MQHSSFCIGIYSREVTVFLLMCLVGYNDDSSFVDFRTSWQHPSSAPTKVETGCSDRDFWSSCGSSLWCTG